MVRMYMVWVYIICGLYGLTSCTSAKHFSGVDKKWREIDKMFQDSFGRGDLHSGFALYDAETMEMLYGYQPNHRLLPASNTKILTCYAALEYLPENLHGLQYFKMDDSTYVRGMGDPGFMCDDEKEDVIMEFLEEQNHIQYVRGPSGLKRWGPGWSWDDYPYYYSAERAIWPIQCNLTSWNNDNALNHNFIFNYINSGGKGINRLEDENIYNVYSPDKGQISDRKIPFKWDEDLLLSVLKQKLGQNLLAGSVSEADWMVSKWNILPGSNRDSVVKKMMKVSDNFLAEQLLINISAGWGNMETGYEAIGRILDSEWSSWKGKIRWVDGSGLSRYNLMSPNFFCFVLGQLYQNHNNDGLFKVFPVVDLNKYDPAAVVDENSITVYAKTGSMSGVFCLSGYILTQGGHKYIFSFMNNNFIGSSTDIKRSMAQILSKIARH
ncbi:D-alanyl-D-alanine carboxypeptidase [Membranihabitans marinus]|uniref:D-alanyl-D-alanine carboxypeptidase n=1 Tax=Membranihabitans marinus TaxID=1227546 RepID=UPI001F3A16A3|nr:D-alanyl-D-alanine carboxypeptidase [Membranihabitans marinus]